MGKQSKMKDWTFLTGDIGWEDYGATWLRKLRDGVYILLRFENMEEWGDGATGYYCDVLQVDLNTLPEKELQSALVCCGINLEEVDPEYWELAKVEACVGYGCYAPLDSTSGDSYPLRVRAKARRIADTYFEDRVLLEERLDRPVNAIGSSAREFGAGNVTAGLERYAQDVQTTGEASDQTKNLMLKLHGVGVEQLKVKQTVAKPGSVVKQIKQSELTAECWMIQIQGVDACKGCEAYQTEDCGGQEILKTGKNEKGILIEKGGL